MQARDLQKILLIQAVEETDRAEQVFPAAERAGATRTALGEGAPPPSPEPDAPLAPAAEGFLARRAQVLLSGLRERAPAIGHLLGIVDGSSTHERLLLAASFIGGLLLPFLAARERINLFALPLIALLVWNLAVYALLIGRALRSPPGEGWVSQFWLGKLYLRWVRRKADAILSQSTRFNAPLAPGLNRFASTWWTSAQRLFEMRTHWLLHLCAALAALGLALGYYYAARAMHMPAGWSGRTLGTSTARGLLMALYGPASALTGIPIPPAERLGELRWEQGGTHALSWVHLMAVTLALYVIVPRLIAASIAGLSSWRASRKLAAPASLTGYAQGLLRGA